MDVLERVVSFSFVSKPPKSVRLPNLTLNHSSPAVTRNRLMLAEEESERYYIIPVGRRSQIVGMGRNCFDDAPRVKVQGRSVCHDA